MVDYNAPNDIRTTAPGQRVATRTANVRKGGGVFLHVEEGKPTAGCVAVPQAQMRAILQWLDPAKRPLIVMEPQSSLRSL